MEPTEQQSGEAPYPVQFAVEYPDRDLDRVRTAFRIVIAIPILVVIAAVSGSEALNTAGEHASTVTVGAGGALFFGPLLMILFRQKYPRWWFDWNLELTRFENRVGAYLALLDDRYPSTDDHQSVVLDFPYPDARNELNRWLPLVKWFLAIPHFIVLAVPLAGGVLRDRLRVVRDPLHGAVPARPVRLRRRRRSLDEPRRGVRVPPRHGPVPAVSAQSLTDDAGAVTLFGSDPRLR